MEETSQPIILERALSSDERDLVRWMLEHGKPDAAKFLRQVDDARVVARCACGCASIDFEVFGLPKPAGGLRVLGDFLYGTDPDLFGAFVFERAGVLAGIEVWSVNGNAAPRALPKPSALRPFTDS